MEKVKKEIRSMMIKGALMILLKGFLIILLGIVVAIAVAALMYYIWRFYTEYDVLTLCAFYTIFGTFINSIIIAATESSVKSMYDHNRKRLIYKAHRKIYKYKRSSINVEDLSE